MFDCGRVTVGVVADGAGGTSGGASAAEQVIAAVERAIAEDRGLMREASWTQVLLEVGVALETAGAGQTTAVVAATSDRLVVGASVGDSGALLISPGGALELTAGQARKPLLGSGLPRATAWSHPIGPRDALLLATDGVLKYAPEEALHTMARDSALSATDRCARMIDAARLPGGGLQDDAGLVYFRPLAEIHEERVSETVRAMAREPSDENERALREALEPWVGAFGDFAGDGLEIDQFDSLGDNRVRITGHVWEVTSQARVPFRVELHLGPETMAGYALQFGERWFSRPERPR